MKWNTFISLMAVL